MKLKNPVVWGPFPNNTFKIKKRFKFYHTSTVRLLLQVHAALFCMDRLDRARANKHGVLKSHIDREVVVNETLRVVILKSKVGWALHAFVLSLAYIGVTSWTKLRSVIKLTIGVLGKSRFLQCLCKFLNIVNCHVVLKHRTINEPARS